AGWQPPMNAMRHFNIWLLDHADIHSSVFPSGHVAASFSAAFGLLAALPELRRIGGAMVVLALLIGIATVYGRYHYAVDVVASIAITVIVWRFLMAWSGPRTMRRGPSVAPAGPRVASTLVLAVALSFAASHAGAADLTLSPDEDLSIARAFAPVLVFHPDEEFFPLNSRGAVAPAGELEAVRDRLATYSAMPRADRLAVSAAGYR